MESLAPYDASILENPERLKDYNQLCSLLTNWNNELNYLDKLFTNAETEEEIEMINFSRRSVALKRKTLITTYFNKYSKYKVGDAVQIIKNNRVIHLGTIEHIEVACNASSIHAFMNGRRKDVEQAYRHFYTVKESFIPYAIDEFMYFISRVTNKFILESFTYRIEESTRIMLAPKKMASKCPICQTKGKPMVNSVIGGEMKIICCDCDKIARDILGDDYVTHTIAFNDLFKPPISKVILDYSERR
jgi:hypothetical protein